MEIQIIDDDGYNARLASASKPDLKLPLRHLYFCVGAGGTWTLVNGILKKSYSDQQLVTLNGTCILDVQLDTRSKQMDCPGGLTRKKDSLVLLDIMIQLNFEVSK